MEIQQYCRVCTSNNTDMLSVFADYNFSECNLQIFEVITKCASVQIQRLDGFPEQICKRCMERLCEAFSFKQLCEDSDYKFRHNLIDGHENNAGCGQTTKIECDKVNENEINNIFIEIKTEVESEFYDEDTEINHDILNEEKVRKSDFTISRNLDANLKDAKPTICYNSKSQTSKFNINLDRNNKQTKIDRTEVNRETNKENTTEHFSSNAGMEIKSEFYAEETNIQYDPENQLNEEKSPTTSQNLEGGLQKTELYNKNVYDCEFCGKYFLEKTILNNHIKEEHKTVLIKQETIDSIEKPYKCETCGKCFQYKGKLSIHNKIHLEKTPFKCKICGKGYMKKLSLNRHNKLHTGEKQHKCEACGKSFIEKHKLNIHMRTHTGDKVYKCEICSKCFSDPSSIYRHKKNHTGEKPHKCETCGKGFIEKHKLNNHRKIHTGDKPYKCETCDKCFRKKPELTVHERSHTGEKLFKCEFCNKCFAVMSNLKEHKRIHTGQKPFKCEICDKCFTAKSTLNVHIKTHTGQKAFKCEICNRCFIQRGQLIRHKNIHNVNN